VNNRRHAGTAITLDSEARSDYSTHGGIGKLLKNTNKNWEVKIVMMSGAKHLLFSLMRQKADPSLRSG
jgi:hypothetical protein